MTSSKCWEFQEYVFLWSLKNRTSREFTVVTQYIFGRIALLLWNEKHHFLMENKHISFVIIVLNHYIVDHLIAIVNCYYFRKCDVYIMTRYFDLFLHATPFSSSNFFPKFQSEHSKTSEEMFPWYSHETFFPDSLDILKRILQNATISGKYISKLPTDSRYTVSQE